MTVQVVKNLVDRDLATSISTLLDPQVRQTPREHLKSALGWETPAKASKVGLGGEIPSDRDGQLDLVFTRALSEIEKFFGVSVALVNAFYHSMEPGAEHGLHCDNCNLDGSPLEEGVEEPNKWSSILYLNDSGSDYTGGEVCFPKQGVTISPETGDYVFFRTDVDHPHEVLKILSGTRKCIVFFFGDRDSTSDVVFSDR
jgi:hypothetical protein